MHLKNCELRWIANVLVFDALDKLAQKEPVRFKQLVRNGGLRGMIFDQKGGRFAMFHGKRGFYLCC